MQGLFPNNGITLTDSGRSALGVIIEALGLQGKRVALPAYLCDSFLPVLRHYDITPVYLDIGEDFQPRESSYAGSFDAAIVVATYGREPDHAIVDALTNRGIVVIEDYAHVPLPSHPVTEMHGAARYYSVGKTLPVPAGGIAVLSRNTRLVENLPRARMTLSFIKDTKKLLPFVATLVTMLRFLLLRGRKPGVPSWRGIASMHRLSERFLYHALHHPHTAQSVAEFRYCYPITAESPRATQWKLLQNGIIAERIWDTLIIDADGADRRMFPNAARAARHTLCVPLWHVRDEDQEAAYEARLQRILPREFAGFRKE